MIGFDNEFDSAIKTAMVYVRPVPGAMDVVDQIVRIREWMSGRGVETEYFTVGHGVAGGVGFENALDRIGQGGIDALIALEPSVLWTDDAERERVESVCSAHGTRVVFVFGGSDAEDAGTDAEGVIPHEDPVLPDGLRLAEDEENGYVNCLMMADRPLVYYFNITHVGEFKPRDLDCGFSIRWKPSAFDKGGIEFRHGIVTVDGVTTNITYAENEESRHLLLTIPPLYVKDADVERLPELALEFADFIGDLMCEDGWVLINPRLVIGLDDVDDGEDVDDGDTDVIYGDPTQGYIRVEVGGMVEIPVEAPGDTETELLMGSDGRSIRWEHEDSMGSITVKMGFYKTPHGKIPVAYRVQDILRIVYLFPGTIYVRRGAYADKEGYSDVLVDLVDDFLDFMDEMGWELRKPLVLGSVTVRGSFGGDD